MKLIHLSDLHLGKRVNEFSMQEEQEYILDKILTIIDDENPDGVLIAGDVYDKTIPPIEAVELFDHFLVELSRRNHPVFVISGNHDSPERISFGRRLMDVSGVHMSPVYDGTVTPITLTDAHGPVDLYMLPFVKPAHVRRYFPEEEIVSYTDAIRVAVQAMNVDESRRNILMTHQFVTGAATSESEELAVGGTDNVDGSVFDCFDYVALGHIHRPQNVGSQRIRYCGTPLKYSFSEAKDQKSVTVVELEKKGELQIRTIPLTPKHDMAEIRGAFAELTARSFYEGSGYPDKYLHITLTDEEDVPEALAKLRIIYPKIMKLDYDNRRTRHHAQVENARDIRQTDPLVLFSEFYEMQNNQKMTEEQSAWMKSLIESIWEDEK